MKIEKPLNYINEDQFINDLFPLSDKYPSLPDSYVICSDVSEFPEIFKLMSYFVEFSLDDYSPSYYLLSDKPFDIHTVIKDLFSDENRISYLYIELSGTSIDVYKNSNSSIFNILSELSHKGSDSSNTEKILVAGE